MLEYDMSDNELRTRLLKEPLRLEAGHVLLPEGPGLGIDLDPLLAAASAAIGTTQTGSSR